VTIPVRVREQLAIHPGCEIELRVVGDELRLRKVGSESAGRPLLVRQLRGRGTSGLSTDEIMQLTRGDDEQ
jgi:bifunctional DNA-binding transcriptional regulator/antitoxin component of YhaV-PrlF toxin-antitoxin module